MMTTLKTKKRLMYTVFAFIFLCGGIEYAVILPTLWLYLHNEYGVPEYMLGLVMSAYSVAAALSSPVTGRICDRTRKTRLIFIVCTLFELAGSVLYLADISVWMCLLSRFISGLGAGSEGIVFAEVARYTGEKERTGIISKLAAIRQIALLFGPGFNLFLRKANFKLGPFTVNQYTSPAGFLIGIWLSLLIIVVVFYHEPAKIYAQELSESKKAVPEQMPNTTQAPTITDISEDQGFVEGRQYSNKVDTDASSHQEIEQVLSEERSSDYQNGVVLSQNHILQDAKSEEDGEDTETHNCINDNSECSPSDESVEFPETAALGSSYDCMLSAEHFMNSNGIRAPALTYMDSIEEIKDYNNEVEERGESSSLLFDENHFEDDANASVVITGQHSLFGQVCEEKRMLLPRASNSQTNGNQTYIQRSSQVIDDPIAREGKLGFFCNEYIRDEIVAIVYVLFCTMFSQICLETMVTPLSLKYLDFGELENSIMYCACGVEIILVFVLVSVLSRCVCDRNMVIFGAIVNVVCNVWLIWFIPRAQPHDQKGNLMFFSLPVFLDVLSLPFLFVCSTSLYSKLTRRETQGLSQGVRRSVVGLGTIMAPLWGSSTVNQPYLLFGVLIGLQGLALILFLGSFKKLAVRQESLVKGIEEKTAPPVIDEERQSLTQGDSNVQRHHPQYGSIQQTSLTARASYQSMNNVDC